MAATFFGSGNWPNCDRKKHTHHFHLIDLLSYYFENEVLRKSFDKVLVFFIKMMGL